MHLRVLPTDQQLRLDAIVIKKELDPDVASDFSPWA